MMMRKQIVPLPLTAAEKFQEAVFFVSEIKRCKENTTAVPFLFSAYLTALKSTVDFLLRQNNSHPRFKTWFQEQMERRSKDPIITQLHELRNTTVHHKPIDKLLFDSGPNFEGEYVEVKRSFEAENWTDAEGNERWKYRLGPEEPWLEHGTIISWVLEFDGREFELVGACQYGLAHVDELISDWNKQTATE
jgi:hypothetical protein